MRELASPCARAYDARFRPYAGPVPDADFNEKSFLSFDASRDYRNLFAARPENAFLIKAAYWIGR